jgi:glucokinase
MIIPIAFPKYEQIPTPGKEVLAADIGGTNTRLSLFHATDHNIAHVRSATYKSNNYNSFTEIVTKFSEGSHLPDRICIGFAGPIVGGKAWGTNLNWNIDSKKVAKELDLEQVVILNDLEANAYGLAALKENELFTVNAGDPGLKGNAAIISPGTGLGEAGLYWDGSWLHPFAGEGGHCDFYPREPIDVRVFDYLREQFDHVSWERLISGQGIVNIYQFLRDEECMDEPSWLAEKMDGKIIPRIISEEAKNKSPICLKTFELFLRYLASEAANLALKMKATGGLFIGGGILPANLELFDKDEFLENFFESGRLRSLLQKVPVHIILNSETALMGAAHYGAYS